MTFRQRLVAKNLRETNGNVSKAMLLAGYPKTTAKNPQQITKSKSWPELLEKYFPDSKLLSKHDELLAHEDAPIRLRALDMSYKLKNKYPTEKLGDNNIAVVNVIKFGEAKKDDDVAK